MVSIEDLEARIRSLVEVQLIKHIPGYQPEDQVMHLLAVAMYNNLVKHDKIHEAPNIYTIVSRPTTLVYWSKKTNLLVDLANALQEIGSEAGLYFSSRPKITLLPDLNLKQGEIRIIASFSNEPVSETHEMSLEQPNEARSDEIPPHSFLVQEDKKIIPLDKSVMNIGRRLTNNIVIDDPRISRFHAQLRVIHGYFVVFDLESSGGTYVNGQRINRSILKPGDIISLAGVILVFDEDKTASNVAKEQTTPIAALSFSNPTLVPRSNQDEIK